MTLVEAKQHLRLDHDFEDALISLYVDAATQSLDGRDGFLGRALITQKWRLSVKGFAAVVSLPLPPLQSVDAVRWRDPDGLPQTLDIAAYRAVDIGGGRPGGVAFTGPCPATDLVSIDFTAGYGPAPADIPAPIRQAILMHVAHLYENRGAAVNPTGATKTVPLGWGDLIQNFRILEV